MKEKSKKILIVGKDYAPDFLGVPKYTAEMAEWIAKRAHGDVRVVTGHPFYPEWVYKGDKYSFLYSVEVINRVKVFRCPLFIPRVPSGVMRMLHSLSYSISSMPIVLFSYIRWKPDKVILISPTLLSAIFPITIGKIFRVKVLLHVQDLEIDLAVNLKLVPAWMESILKGFEKIVYSKVDKITTISEKMLFKIEEKGISRDKISLFPNWVDTGRIYPNRPSGEVLREKYGLLKTDFVILYSGNLAFKQGFELLIQLSELLSYDDSVHLLIVGNGPSKDKISKIQKNRLIKNISIHPLVPTHELNSLLNIANLHIVLQKPGLDDYILPSKITSILAVGGQLIVTGSEDSEVGNLVKKYPGILQLFDHFSVSEILQSIEKIKETGEGKSVNKIALDYSKTNIEKEAVLSNFYKLLTSY